MGSSCKLRLALFAACTPSYRSPLMVCESPCPGQEYLFMGETVLQLCRYPGMPRIHIHYFTRLNYSSYTAVNSLSAAKCLCWDQSWEEKSKNESKLLAGVSSEPECFLSQWGWAAIFQLKEKCWIFACGRWLNCEFNEWPHNGIYDQETFKRWRPIWNPNALN